MPDYSIIKSLCDELEISVAELMNGKVTDDKISCTCDEKHIVDLLRWTQELEKQKNLLYGILLIVMGVAFQALSYTFGGSAFQDFISGLMRGISIGGSLVGAYVIGKSIANR